MLLLACDYGNASRLWYYLGNTRRVYVLPKFKFANNYAYWNDQLNLNHRSGIFVCDKPLIRNIHVNQLKYFNVDDTNMCLTKIVYANPLNRLNSKAEYYSLINFGNGLWQNGAQKVYYINKSFNDFNPLDTYFKKIKLIEKTEVEGFFSINKYFIYAVSNS
jgi:hypothetical protein